MSTATEAAAKGWWTWALSNGTPEHPDTAEMKKLLARFDKGVASQLEKVAFTEKPSVLAKELEPFLVLKDHWRVCLLELIIAERKGMYERAREAYFRPFKVDDSTRTRRDSKSMKHTTTTYVQLLIKRTATAEALRILDFMERRYTLEPHIYAFERAQVFDRLEEYDKAFPWLAMALLGSRTIKKRFEEGYGIFRKDQLFKTLHEQPDFEEVLKSPRKFLEPPKQD